VHKIRRHEIVDFYRRQTAARRQRLGCTLEEFTMSHSRGGLGDTAILTALPRAGAGRTPPPRIYTSGPHFHALCKFNPYYRAGTTPFWVMADDLMHTFDLGNGHFIQRLQRAMGVPVDVRPRGTLVVDGVVRNPGRIVFHFEPSADITARQRQRVHPRAREVYPETRAILQRFVDDHPQMRFSEVGARTSGFKGVTDWTGLPLEETIVRMASCDYFVGIPSGPIINFPPAGALCFPVLRDIRLIETEWLYPQSTILHQDEDGPFVRQFSAANLERAFNGELYPYWSEDYLDLVEEAASLF
jgi:hypothetical protein